MIFIFIFKISEEKYETRNKKIPNDTTLSLPSDFLFSSGLLLLIPLLLLIQVSHDRPKARQLQIVEP